MPLGPYATITQKGSNMQFGSFVPVKSDNGDELSGACERQLYTFANGFDASVVHVTEDVVEKNKDLYSPTEVGTYEICLMWQGFPLGLAQAIFGVEVPEAWLGTDEPGIHSRLSEAAVLDLLTRVDASQQAA